MKASLLLSSLVLLAGLTGCQQSAPPPSAGPAFKPVASLQDLMVAVIDPAADALWDSVGSETTKAGVVERQPRSDDDWQALRKQAVTLVESANLLRVPQRPVTLAGAKVEDAHVAGVLSAEAIQLAIDRDRPAFEVQVANFQTVAGKLLKAVDDKSVPGLLEAGGHLQEACESCHARYWYPHARRPGS